MLGISTVATIAGSILRESQEAKGIPYVPTPPTRREKIVDAIMTIFMVACFVIPAVAFTGWVVVMAWVIGN